MKNFVKLNLLKRNKNKLQKENSNKNIKKLSISVKDQFLVNNKKV